MVGMALSTCFYAVLIINKLATILHNKESFLLYAKPFKDLVFTLGIELLMTLQQVKFYVGISLPHPLHLWHK